MNPKIYAVAACVLAASMAATTGAGFFFHFTLFGLGVLTQTLWTWKD